MGDRPQRPHPECVVDDRGGQGQDPPREVRVAGVARLRGMTPSVLLVEFAHGVHARHLAGLSLGAGS